MSYSCGGWGGGPLHLPVGTSLRIPLSLALWGLYSLTDLSDLSLLCKPAPGTKDLLSSHVSLGASICLPHVAAGPASPGDTKSQEHPCHPGKACPIPREQRQPLSACL